MNRRGPPPGISAAVEVREIPTPVPSISVSSSIGQKGGYRCPPLQCGDGGFGGDVGGGAARWRGNALRGGGGADGLVARAPPADDRREGNVGPQAAVAIGSGTRI